MFYLHLKTCAWIHQHNVPKKSEQDARLQLRQEKSCYLSGLCTVQLSDEIVERVGLPKKNEVVAEAVSSDCRTGEMEEKTVKY